MSDPFNTSTTSGENQVPRYPYANPRRPSDLWFEKPAFVDGASNPPIFFPTVEEIHDTFLFHGGDPEVLLRQQQASQLTPTPTAPVLSAPITPSLVPTTANHYRTEVAHDPGAPTPLFVNVAVLRTVTVPAAGPRKKPTTKKEKAVKMQPVVLDGITRVKFLEEVFKMHGLTNDYSPGVHSGPDFKLSWTGSGGGKSGAPSIHNDADFDVLLNALLAKRGKAPQVQVELDLDTMDGFRITPLVPLVRALGATGDEGHEELVYGTRVPQVANFSEVDQIQGGFILQLKQHWPCQQHQGEHGEPGFCYVNPSGAHTRLNPRRLKEWAAAMAAGEATRFEPPNTASFDGARDGRLPLTKSRGQSGPHAHSQSQVGISSDAILQFFAAVGPALAEITRKRGLSDAAIRTPPCRPVAKRAKIFSPLPAHGQELHICLRDFLKEHGIDLTMHEAVLAQDNYTPDVIPSMGDGDLREILNVTAGIALKFKLFCKDWHNHYKAKKAAISTDD